MSKLTDTYNNLQTISQDRAAFNAMIAAYPDFLNLCSTLVKQSKASPLPAATTMTAVQIGIFDNSARLAGKKVAPTSSRYGACVEVWTVPAEQMQIAKVGNCQRSVTALMYSPAGILAASKRLRGNSISDAYADWLDGAAAGLDPCDLVGMLASKRDGGTVFHPFQTLVLKGGVTAPTGFLFTGAGECTRLSDFVSKQPDGETDLGGNVILQSRHDPHQVTQTWATKLPSQ